MGKQYYKDAFDNIAPAKRKRVLQTAIREFSRNGYAAVSVNDIAHKADISVGSVYTYFKSKQDLLLTVAAESLAAIRQADEGLAESSGHLKDDLVRLFSAVVRNSNKLAQFVRLSVLLSTEELAGLVSAMADQHDQAKREIYLSLLEAARQRGEINSQLDLAQAAWLIANQADSLQQALVNRYHKRRLAAYLGAEAAKDSAGLVEALSEHLVRSFR